jgi:hypothetical protein
MDIDAVDSSGFDDFLDEELMAIPMELFVSSRRVTPRSLPLPIYDLDAHHVVDNGLDAHPVTKNIGFIGSKLRKRKTNPSLNDVVEPSTLQQPSLNVAVEPSTLQQPSMNVAVEPSSLKQPFKQPSYSEDTVPNAVYDSEDNRKPTPIMYDSTSIKYLDSKNNSVVSVPPIDLSVTEIERSDEFADNHQLIKASSIQAAAMLEHGEFRYEEL